MASCFRVLVAAVLSLCAASFAADEQGNDQKQDKVYVPQTRRYQDDVEDISTVKQLIESERELKSQTDDVVEAYRAAIFAGNIEVVQQYVADGISNLYDALADAIKAGHVGMVRLLLEESFLGKPTLSSMNLAAQGGNAEIVRLLIAAGAELDYKSEADDFFMLGRGPYSYTPLGFASINGHAAVVEELLKAGVQVNYDLSGLIEAFKRGDKKMAALLINAHGKMSLMAVALASRWEDVDYNEAVATSLGAGAEIDKHYGELGGSALAVAIRKGHLSFLRALLKAGPNIGTKSCYGMTAVEFAKIQRPPNKAVIQLLKEDPHNQSILQRYMLKEKTSKKEASCYHPLLEDEILTTAATPSYAWGKTRFFLTKPSV